MYAGVAPIRLLFDRDCHSDIVLSIDVLVVTRNKPYTILDCVDTPEDITWW